MRRPFRLHRRGRTQAGTSTPPASAPRSRVAHRTTCGAPARRGSALGACRRTSSRRSWATPTPGWSSASTDGSCRRLLRSASQPRSAPRCPKTSAPVPQILWKLRKSVDSVDSAKTKTRTILLPIRSATPTKFSGPDAEIQLVLSRKNEAGRLVARRGGGRAENATPAVRCTHCGMPRGSVAERASATAACAGWA